MYRSILIWASISEWGRKNKRKCYHCSRLFASRGKRSRKGSELRIMPFRCHNTRRCVNASPCIVATKWHYSQTILQLPHLGVGEGNIGGTRCIVGSHADLTATVGMVIEGYYLLPIDIERKRSSTSNHSKHVGLAE